jgi:hypothetical protein
LLRGSSRHDAALAQHNVLAFCAVTGRGGTGLRSEPLPLAEVTRLRSARGTSVRKGGAAPVLSSIMAETRKGERLANREFSAPEQEPRGSDDPQSTMDIYAVGQLIQWLVTGNVHMGTGCTRLGAFDESFGHLQELRGEIDAFFASHRRPRPVAAGQYAGY